MNVLVVDDETIMREAFSRLFDWESYGLSPAGQAKNGKEALEIIREKNVDIVITDLKMPVMDGLTLIAEAQKIKPQLKFVVLSAFDSFDLVSEAFKLGARDYFLKVNLDADKVLSVLSKLSEEIKTERLLAQNQREEQVFAAQQREKLSKLEATMSRHEQVLREQLLKKLLFSKTGDATMSDQLQEAGIVLSRQKLRVMVLVIENYYDVEKTEWRGERELLKFGILNLTEEVLSATGRIYGFCNLPHEYVLLYSEELLDNGRTFARDLFSALKAHLERCFGFSVSAGLSGVTDGFAGCQGLYEQARQACAYKFIRGRGILILADELKEKTAGVRPALDGKAEAFRQFLPQAREPEQLLSGIPAYRLDGSLMVPEDEKAVRELYYVYYYEILEYIKQYSLSDRENLRTITNTFARHLKDNGTLPELNKWLVATLEALAKEMDQTGLASRAKRYINQNYSRDIALRDVADHLGISESYLSRVFKKDTGDSFSNYILNVRMEAALELMKNTNYKVYEIAGMVGYNNVEYFSRQFKKVTGKSPGAFMR